MEFSTFPLELRRKIYNQCTPSTLSNISQTSKSFHEDVMPVLWGTVVIKWEFLESQWLVENVSQKMEHYTSSLKIYSWEDDFEDENEDNDEDENEDNDEDENEDNDEDENVDVKLLGKFLSVIGSCNRKRLRTLEIEDRLVPHCIQYAACHFLNLEKLVVRTRTGYKFRITKEEMEHLNRIPRLKSLTIENAYVNRMIWLKICQMETLETLDLSDLYWDPRKPNYAGMRNFKLTNLRYLRISENYSINDDFLAIIGSNCVKLEQLDVSDNHALDDEDQIMTDVGVSCISQILSLKHLYLSNTVDYFIKPHLTDASLLSLSKLPMLESLDLRGVCKRVTNHGLLHLSQLTTLKDLNIGGMLDVTDEGFQHIGNLTSLLRLNMHNLRKLTNLSLVAISKLKLLYQIDILGCIGFTDAGLHHLAGLQHLKFVEYHVSGIFSKEALHQHGLLYEEQSSRNLEAEQLFSHAMIHKAQGLLLRDSM